MRAADIPGTHPGWERYLNGPADYRALQRIRGIGAARGALLLRLYGSVDQFLQADPGGVAERTGGLIGAGLARTLQERCRDAGLGSDWSRLEELAAVDEEDEAEEGAPDGLGRVGRWTQRLRRWWSPRRAALLEPPGASG